MANPFETQPTGQVPNSWLTPLGQSVWGSPDANATAQDAAGTQPPVGGSPSGYTKPSSGGVEDSSTFQTAINQMRTKMQSDNKLIAARNATYKHMYDQPLTDEEKGALTPQLQHAISTGNRGMIDNALSAITQQLKGYDNTIDTNLSAYTTAFKETQDRKQAISDNVS